MKPRHAEGLEGPVSFIQFFKNFADKPLLGISFLTR